MKKRIVIDATPLLYSENGIGRVTRNLISGLRRLDAPFEYHIYGRRLQGRPLRELFPDLPATHLRLPRSAEKGIKALRAVEALCRADLYHATDFYMPLGDPSKCVATIHDIIFLAQPEMMVDHQRLREWVPDFSRKCRRIIAISEFSKQNIVGYLDIPPDRIDVVYCGVDSTIFFPEPDADKVRKKIASFLGTNNPFFLAVSCSVGRKNTPLLLDAYAELLHNNPCNDLVLVWNPPDNVRAKVAAFKHSERVHFTGRVDDRMLRCLYNGATAVMYPSLYEGFGLPVIEAMSCGSAVITSRNSSLPEVGGEAAIYVEPRDAASIVRALECFENRPKLASELREKSIEQAAKFTWERCSRETLAVYRRCLEE